MRISPITNTNIYNHNRCYSVQPCFTHHPDFYKYNSTESCYFRRGAVILQGDGYKKIENIFAEILGKNGNKPEQILIVGIGHSQEPFSYMASIKGIIKNNKLKDYIDLYTVDLQSKPTFMELKRQALPHLFEYEKFPKYAKKGFVKDTYAKWLGHSHEKISENPMKEHFYLINNPKPKEEATFDRVNDEIFDFVKITYDNPQKSKWESRIQEAVFEYPDEKFDIISANNILPYIESEKDEINTIKQIGRVLKTNGYFITDPYEFRKKSIKEAGLDNFTEIASGIYQKL